jgi:hypothetical protein
MPNIGGSSVRNLLHVTLLVPRILRILLDFWKVCAPLMYILYTSISFQFLVLEWKVNGVIMLAVSCRACLMVSLFEVLHKNEAQELLEHVCSVHISIPLNCVYGVLVSTNTKLCLQCPCQYLYCAVSAESMSLLVLRCIYSVHVSTSIVLCLQCPCQY